MQILVSGLRCATRLHKRSGGCYRDDKDRLYLCHRYSGMKLKEIGGHFNIGDSAVSEAGRQFAVLLNKNNKLKKQIELVRRQLKF